MSKQVRVRHIKKGDTVVALSGAHLGKFGKVLEVKHSEAAIQVEGVGLQKKHAKPTQTNPKGGIIEILRWWPASKFQVCDASGKALGRTSFAEKNGKKERVFSKKRK